MRCERVPLLPLTPPDLHIVRKCEHDLCAAGLEGPLLRAGPWWGRWCLFVCTCTCAPACMCECGCVSWRWD